jgi:hypothetical protein
MLVSTVLIMARRDMHCHHVFVQRGIGRVLLYYSVSLQPLCCHRHDDSEHTYVVLCTYSSFSTSPYVSVGSGTTPTVVLNLHTRGGYHSMTDNFIRSDNFKMTTLSSVDCTYYIITLLKVAILTLTIAAKKDYAITVQKVAILTLTIATKILCNYGTKRGNPNPNDCRKKKTMQLRY